MRSQRFLGFVSGVVVAGVLAGADAAGQGGGRRQAPPEQKAPPKKKAAAAKKAAPTPVAYTDAVVHVGNTVVLRHATVLAEGDKITAVGRRVDLPKGTKIVDCKGMHICPGFVIFDLSGVGAPSRVGKDGSYRDGIDPFNPALERALAAGITSYLTTSTKSGSTPSGTSAVLKLVPGSLDGVVVKEPAVYSMSVPLGPAGWHKLEETLKAVKKYDEDLAAYEKKKAAGDRSAKPPRKPSPYDAIHSVMAGKTKLRISGGGRSRGGMSRMPRFGAGRGGMTVERIREALRVGKSLGTGVVLDRATEAWIIPDEIAAAHASCLLQPRTHVMPDPKRSDPNGSSIHACRILAKAGVPVAVLPPGGIFGSGIGSGGILGRDLNTPTIDPCFAVRGGMDGEEALSTITLYPAMMMGVDDRIGSLEEGKDADLLILDGDPLHYKTFVQTVVVNGKVVYEKDKEPFYRHIRPRASNH